MKLDFRLVIIKKMNCYPCKKKHSHGKIWLDDGYYNVSCKQIANTNTRRYFNGFEFGGYRICLIKCSKGFLCWVGEGNKDGTSYRHSHTAIFKNDYDAITAAKALLEKPKDRQLDLFFQL